MGRDEKNHPPRLILDSGAVIGLARGDSRARAHLTLAVEQGLSVEIPVVVLAETLRGSARDAPIHRLMKAVGSTPPTVEAHGRLAGRLLGSVGSSSTVDALVVAHAAARGGGRILTGDPDDLRPLAAAHRQVLIETL